MVGHLNRIILAVGLFLVAALVYHQWRGDRGGYGFFDFVQGKVPTGETYTVPTKPTLTDADVPGLAKYSEESAKLAAAVLPSVVSVNTTGKRTEVLFRDIFGRSYGREVDDPRLGSGVIVSKEGHVMTNFHVVQNSQHIQITTSDRKTFDAEFIGGDPKADIAVLRIASNRKDFPALNFANSDEAKVGQVVFAIGNPFGLTGTVTQGIISATQRRLSDNGNDFLQTNTVINPGNSGGPLVNVRGEIVGINAAIFGEGQVRAWQGVGLAIPANEANNSFKAIMSHGSVASGGYLGLSVLRITVSVDSSLGGSTHGAMVANIAPGSPAATAGLEEGDVIIKYGDRNFNTPMDLMKLIDEGRPGQAVAMLVVRNDQLLTLTAVVRERPPGK